MFPRSLQCSWTCEIDFLIQEQKLVPQELELDGLEEETSTDKEKKEKEEAENIDEAKKIVEALTKSEGESCKYTLLKNLISQTHRTLSRLKNCRMIQPSTLVYLMFSSMEIVFLWSQP